MNSTEKDNWLSAMNMELNAFYANEVVEVVDRSDAHGKQVIPSRWVFTVKNEIDQ